MESASASENETLPTDKKPRTKLQSMLQTSTRSTKGTKRDDEYVIDITNDGESESKQKRKWSKYTNTYKPQWESIEIFAKWLRRTPDSLISLGKKEAFCTFCQQCLRPHKSDLLAHARSKKHKDAENNQGSSPRIQDCRSFLESYEPDIDVSEGETTNEQNDSISDPTATTRKTRGRPLKPKPTLNHAAVLEQINSEMEETDEKIRVCQEELNSLRIKKARLEREMDYYSNN